MENNSKRYMYYILNSKSPLFIENDDIITMLKKHTSYEINGNCTDEELNGDYKPNYVNPKWYDFLINNKDSKVLLLIINLNDTPLDKQKRFIGIVKDKNHQVLSLPDNCKIIVTANKKDDIDDEIASCLVVI